MPELQPFEIDSSRMPVVLGSALKVPSYAYENWGIPSSWYREQSDQLYEAEWKGGSPRQMQYVIEAVTRAGLGNYSQMLRDANARVVSYIVRNADGRVNYLEPGAGVSTVTMYEKLIQDDVDPEKIFVTMVEPSESRVENAAQKIAGLGLTRGRNFRVCVGRDIDVPNFVEPESQHIVSSVAQIHHHAYLDTPLKALNSVIIPRGNIIIADWHNSMWEHPNRVYEFLKSYFEWDSKEADLREFARMYPKALETAPLLSGPEAEANYEIQRFWKGWESVRKEAIAKGEFQPGDDILMLEGHRPVYKQIDEMRPIGMSTNPNHVGDFMSENPIPLLPTSGLLYLTVGNILIR